VLQREEYIQWKERFDKVSVLERVEQREKEMRKSMQQLEKNMQFLGITGVEDKLQEDVCQTLENIR